MTDLRLISCNACDCLIIVRRIHILLCDHFIKRDIGLAICLSVRLSVCFLTQRPQGTRVVRMFSRAGVTIALIFLLKKLN